MMVAGDACLMKAGHYYKHRQELKAMQLLFIQKAHRGT